MRRGLLACLLLAGVLALTGRGAALAQSDPLDLVLVSQTLWVEPPADMRIVFEHRGTLPDDAVVTATVHARVDPPVTGFERAVNGDLPRIVLGLFRTPVADLPRDDTGRLLLTIPTDVLDGERENAVVLAEEGLYPVRVSVRSVAGDDLAAPLVLFLLRTGPGTQARPPMAVATVLPVDSGPTVAPGSLAVTVTPEARDRAALVTEALEDVPDVPVTLLVRPELLDALGRTGLPADAELTERMAAALGTRPAAAVTYTDVDPSALVGADLAPELAAALVSGEDVLAAVLPEADTGRSSWVSEAGLDTAGLSALRDLGVRSLLVPAGVLSGVGDPTGTGALAVGTDVVEAAAADPVLSALMEPGTDPALAGDPVLAANQLLARLTATWLGVVQADGPRHGAALLPQERWLPDPVFLGTLLAGLRELPSTEPVTLDDLFADVDAELAAVAGELQLAPFDPVPFTTSFAQRLSGLRFEQAGLASMVPPGTAALGEVDLLVELSLSRSLTDAEREAYLDTADAVLAPLTSSVEIVLPSTVTLAGRTSEIPLTVRSSLPYPVDVRLRLTSPKLVFPEGDPVLTVDGSVQLRIPVEARSNGTFPLEVTAVTPGGDVPVSSTAEATVRVTAVAGLGLALSVGAGLVLLTWWVHHARTVRRARRLAASSDAATRHPSAGPALPAPTAEHPVVPAVTGRDPGDTAEHPVVTAPDPGDTAEHPVVGP